MLKTIEPFAYGYITAKGSVSTKIAAGMYAVCENLPLDIDPEIGLAGYDRAGSGNVEQLVCNYIYGDGIVCREQFLDARIKEHPEYEKELMEYRDTFKKLVTYRLASDEWPDNVRKLQRGRILWGGTWGGHSNPDYGMLLRLGTDGIREKIAKYRKINDADEWYDACLTVLDGMDLLAERFRAIALTKMDTDPANRALYQKIADALAVVPKRPAYDFMSAAQCFYLAFTLDGKDSPGTFDQYMIDYWRRTEHEEARRILEGIWIGFNKMRAWNLCICGSDENGNDLSNELSWEILDVAAKYRFNTPNLTMRWHKNLPDSILRKAIDTLGTGIGMPAMYNDEVVCPALEQLGIPPHDSHLYAMNGCNQIDIQGKSHMGLEDGELCLLKCVEFGLHDGVCQLTNEKLGADTGDAAAFTSFDQLFDAYKKQVEYCLSIVVWMANHSQSKFSEFAPNPFRSCLIEGCIEKGRDYKSGGPTYNHGQILTEGLADAIDSLAAIRHFVFDTKTYTMQELLNALKADFVGYEDMQYALKSYKKFGNGDDEIDTLGAEVLAHFFTDMQKYRTFRDPVNGIYGGGLSTFNRTAGYGAGCAASANGRNSRGPILADSIGAAPGMDKNGPTGVIHSALRFDQKLAKSGFVLQLKFDARMFNTEKGKAGFAALLRTYFENGGQQLTTNVLSAEDLLAAKKEPEKYRNLIVRVGGYSDYFVNLPEGLQDNVIARTMNSI